MPDDFHPLTNFLITLGLTRDSFIWFYSRLAAGCLLILSGVINLNNYFGPNYVKTITIIAAVVLWFSGKYDSSPLPGAKK